MNPLTPTLTYAQSPSGVTRFVLWNVIDGRRFEVIETRVLGAHWTAQMQQALVANMVDRLKAQMRQYQDEMELNLTP